MKDASAVVSVLAVVVIVVVMILGALRSWSSEDGDAPEPMPTASGVGDGHSEGNVEDSAVDSSAPANVPATGSEHLADGDVPAHEEERVLRRAADFWRAFSLRDPRQRDQAIRQVAVPYLARLMQVRSTARIPIVEPDRQVIASGSFTEATVVSRAGTTWWYVTLIFDPVSENWSAQTYERATPGLIMAANRIAREGR